MNKIQVVVVGPFGQRLGTPVCDALLAAPDEFFLAAGVIGPEDSDQQGLGHAPLVRDFSRIEDEACWNIHFVEDHSRTVVFYAVRAEALFDRLSEAVDHGYTRHVIGTTGLTDATMQYCRTLGRNESNIVIHAPNFSEGVWIGANQCTELAAHFPNYDAEIVEAHHKHKADAPSGTAMVWAKAIALARGLDPVKAIKCGRNGNLGERDPNEIWISSVRGGSVTGYHRATFYGPHDEISVEHNVRSSALFAQGALPAIRWAASEDREPGFYGMPHVLWLTRLIALGLA